LTFQLDCDIFFLEHSLTSFLFVSQLQLEACYALLATLFFFFPLTFRDEPNIS